MAARSTRPRRILEESLDSQEDFLSAQEIFQRLAANNQPISLATVYRHLAALAADGKVDVVLRPEGEALYRRCSEPHHHHLVCRDCGRTQEIGSSQVEEWLTAEALRHNYQEIQHRVEMFGVCADCQTT